MKGVSNIQSNTGLRGRWETLKDSPLTIADIGHNEEGIKFAVSQLNELLLSRTNSQLHIVFGMVKDKEVANILSLLPKNAIYYFCQANLPRSLEVQELLIKAKSFNLKGEKYSTVSLAYKAAQDKANKDDIIFIGGSTFIVAEAL